MIPERLLLGPGPSPVSARVMRAMANPVLSHLDPEMMRILDEVRGKLGRIFAAGEGAFTFAVSGTGTSGMEAAVANVTAPGAKVLVVVTGYFGARLAEIFSRYGAEVARVDVEWGRACDPQAVETALASRPADIVAMVQAETSTGVLNPVADVMRIARAHGALTVVDAVTSLGGMPVETGAARHRRLLQLFAERTGGAVRARPDRLLVARPRRARAVAAASIWICPCSRTTGCSASITTRFPRR